MDVRTRDMAELIVLDHDTLWLRTNLLPAEVICKLGVIISTVPIESVISWLQ
jgi:hypothetical protein